MCGRAGVPEESPGEAKGEDAAQQWSGASRSLEDKLCVLQRAEPEKRPRPLGEAQEKIMSESKIVALFICVGSLVLLCSIVTVPWFFPLQVRKY
ncbi:hypothetical protein I79_014339 [Cricetulus griseus]|uniref:Uncharacterized protein n=1 Tax=Cricetulus griseus TaxID=10029 RepID=G3HTW0_CRIGR|nr:hypothetical protein I79_014339 [Cricetulus griseus]